jgi:hypothetical protein
MASRAREWTNNQTQKRKLGAKGWGPWCNGRDKSREENANRINQFRSECC